MADGGGIWVTNYTLCAWGWVRLAVAGVAGAHERPLALLLLHLGAAQARS